MSNPIQRIGIEYSRPPGGGVRTMLFGSIAPIKKDRDKGLMPGRPAADQENGSKGGRGGTTLHLPGKPHGEASGQGGFEAIRETIIP